LRILFPGDGADFSAAEKETPPVQAGG